jgi:hypothetical protein
MQVFRAVKSRFMSWKAKESPALRWAKSSNQSGGTPDQIITSGDS